MPSSTSSSDARLPRLDWRSVLTGAAALFLASLCLLEGGLAWRGIRPNRTESVRAWTSARAQADAAGPAALALVGNSRILLDADLTVLRARSGLEPVQLGIEGNSFAPVLAALARDPSFRGSVLVDVDFQTLVSPPAYDAASAYERQYALHRDDGLDFRRVEDALTDLLHAGLRSYADGTRPATALWDRLVHAPDPVQYLKVLPDREILADYRRVPMPYMYYFRALRDLDGSADLPPGKSYAEIGSLIEAGISRLEPVDAAPVLDLLPVLRADVAAIRAKGGQVYFARFPRSGYIREMDDRRYPRDRFWSPFTAAIPVPSVDFEDVPGMASLFCPDGSHLDYRDRRRFTEALVTALHLDARTP